LTLLRALPEGFYLRSLFSNSELPGKSVDWLKLNCIAAEGLWNLNDLIKKSKKSDLFRSYPFKDLQKSFAKRFEQTARCEAGSLLAEMKFD
jgi:hypothetical protein